MASAPTSAGTSGDVNAPLPTLQSNGRRSARSSQLSLTAAEGRIATIAQELFAVVGSERGTFKHSEISTGMGGEASFTRSIPTANLSTTLARLGSCATPRSPRAPHREPT